MNVRVMSVQALELAVGTRAAAKLEILKSKMSDELEQRFAPARNQPTTEGLVTFVTRVTPWTSRSDVIELNCGHNLVLEADETNASLKGAETICDKEHHP